MGLSGHRGAGREGGRRPSQGSRPAGVVGGGKNKAVLARGPADDHTAAQKGALAPQPTPREQVHRQQR